MSYLWLIPVATAIWVGIDASNLGVKRGRLGGGFIDMGVAAYVICTLLIGVLILPFYLVARARYVTMKNQYGYGATPAYGSPAFGVATYGSAPYLQTAPPQYSPDGQWWWNGQAWSPVNHGGTPT